MEIITFFLQAFFYFMVVVFILAALGSANPGKPNSTIHSFLDKDHCQKCAAYYKKWKPMIDGHYFEGGDDTYVA